MSNFTTNREKERKKILKIKHKIGTFFRMK